MGLIFLDIGLSLRETGESGCAESKDSRGGIFAGTV
jgi:hypothetical protein